MRSDKHYSVRSVALRGDDDETLEVCIAADDTEDSLQETGESDCSTGGTCSACPPDCSDPHCVACLQKCPHRDQEYHGYPGQYRRGGHLVKHPKYRSKHAQGQQ